MNDSDIPAFYKGTYIDIVGPVKGISAGGESGILALLLLDLPFSFIVDTLLLPYDIYKYYSVGQTPEENNNKD